MTLGSSATDPIDDARRRRLVMGGGVIALALVVDLAFQSIFGPPHAASVGHLAFFALEFVSVVAACLLTNLWSRRRGYGPLGRLTRAVIVAGLVGAAFGVIVTWRARHDGSSHGSTPHSMLAFVAFGFVRGVVVCGLWALGFVYPLAVEAEQLRGSAELSRLRSHLEPHFLLNTLNMIAGLVREDPSEAERLIGCLGELLRDAVEERPSAQTLGDEIAWLRRYAAILEARHRGSIRFCWEVTDGASEQHIPRLLLQPLVENAVKHGALRRADGGSVTVRAAIDETRGVLRCVVIDDGPGLADTPVREGAFGLRSVKRRLALECIGATFRMESSREGTQAVVEIPVRGRRRA